MLFAIKEDTFPSAIETTVTQNINIMTSQVMYNELMVQVILVYGPQENEDNEIIQTFYEDLGIEIESCVYNGGVPMVVGDINAKIAYEHGQITSLSNNGTMLKKLIEDNNLKVVNFHSTSSH